MVLFSFSIADHISKIKDASKHQTTRIPRKIRSNGKPAYSVGEKVQLYYRSRMKESCDNCLTTPQPSPCNFWHDELTECNYHKNFFGESEIIDIIHYHSGDYKENGHETWMGYLLGDTADSILESWARADGFKNWEEADAWFVGNKKDGYDNFWYHKDLDVIVWDKEPIIKRWQQK